MTNPVTIQAERIFVHNGEEGVDDDDVEDEEPPAKRRALARPSPPSAGPSNVSPGVSSFKLPAPVSSPPSSSAGSLASSASVSPGLMGPPATLLQLPGMLPYPPGMMLFPPSPAGTPPGYFFMPGMGSAGPMFILGHNGMPMGPMFPPMVPYPPPMDGSQSPSPVPIKKRPEIKREPATEYKFDYDPTSHSKSEIKRKKRMAGEVPMPPSYSPDPTKVPATYLNEVPLERPAEDPMIGPDLAVVEAMFGELSKRPALAAAAAALPLVKNAFALAADAKDPNPPPPVDANGDGDWEMENKFKLDPQHVVQTCDLVRFKINMVYMEYELVWNHLLKQQQHSLSQIDAMSRLPVLSALIPHEAWLAKKNRVFQTFEQCKRDVNKALQQNVTHIYKKFKDVSHPTLTGHGSRVLKAWYALNIRNPYPSEDLKRLLAFKSDLIVKQVTTWFGNHRGRTRRRIQDQGIDPDQFMSRRNGYRGIEPLDSTTLDKLGVEWRSDDSDEEFTFHFSSPVPSQRVVATEGARKSRKRKPRPPVPESERKRRGRPRKYPIMPLDSESSESEEDPETVDVPALNAESKAEIVERLSIANTEHLEGDRLSPDKLLDLAKSVSSNTTKENGNGQQDEKSFEASGKPWLQRALSLLDNPGSNNEVGSD